MARKRDTEMAIAERELTAEDQTDVVNTENDDDDDIHTEKAKRERVDLEKADPESKVMLSISVPAGMKLALIKQAEADGVSATNWSRSKLAKLIQYQIPASFTERTRKSKYNTEEEREAAKQESANKAKAKRDQIAAFMKSLKANPDLAAQIASQTGVELPV